MMQKTDIANKDTDGYVPLMSQNISVVEVGAYSQISIQPKGKSLQMEEHIMKPVKCLQVKQPAMLH